LPGVRAPRPQHLKGRGFGGWGEERRGPAGVCGKQGRGVRGEEGERKGQGQGKRAFCLIVPPTLTTAHPDGD